MNEEEVKVKIVLPWLKLAGVDESDLQLERSFTIRIGRQEIEVGKKANTAIGRLDILVRIGQKNLFIVETKASHLTLTDQDRDQAISYARLVHPIAPYAVVTNGSDHRLYDVLTKEQIEPSSIRVDGFEIALPEEDLVAAQKLFLGLNPANLVTFCQRQVTAELRWVKGTIEDGRKYVPELHVARSHLVQQVDEFFRGATPGLLLVGDSGLGKTCEMCAIVEGLLKRGKPVLFFNGFHLEGDLISAIASEFNWVFSGPELPVQVLKRLETAAGQAQITIAIDAIDEWQLNSRVNHLASLLKAAENRKIKVLATCKASALDLFLSSRGNPTATSILAIRVAVPPFVPKEFFEVLEKYRKAYQFQGAFEDAVLQQAMDNPFLLRVLFDVARNSKATDITFSSSEFFDAYYARMIEKTGDPQRAERTLRAIASLLYERDVDSIAESVLRAALGLSINEGLMDELFEYEILVRGGGDTTDAAVAFYFQQFRDYIIAIKSAEFPKLRGTELLEVLKKSSPSGVRVAALMLYYRLAPMSRKLLFDADVRATSARYLATYVSLVRSNFPALEGQFKPTGPGRVGFVGELNFPDIKVDMYGFRRLGKDDDEVHFIPVQSRSRESNLAFLAGASSLHSTSSSQGFRGTMDFDREVRKNEVLRQVLAFVETGRLEESSNLDLCVEYIIKTILRHRKIFASLFDTGGTRVSYPLQLDTIPECILREKLARQFEDDVVTRKRMSGEIQETWKGTTVSYSHSLSSAEREAIRNSVEDALAGGAAPMSKARFVDLEDLESRLITAVGVMRRTSSAIESPPAFLILHDALARGTAVPREELKDCLRALYAAFLSNYRTLVETNFPTLREHFGLYSEHGVAAYLVLGGRVNSGWGHHSMSLAVYHTRSTTGCDSVEIVDDVVLERGANKSLRFIVNGAAVEGISCSRTTVDSLVHRDYRLRSSEFQSMSLRSLVYSQILDELHAADEAFLA